MRVSERPLGLLCESQRLRDHARHKLRVAVRRERDEEHTVAEIVQQLGCGLLDGGTIGQAQAHEAALGLVRDRVAAQLGDDREADLRGGSSRVGRVSVTSGACSRITSPRTPRKPVHCGLAPKPRQSKTASAFGKSSGVWGLCQ